MSVPNTLHALPARVRSAVKADSLLQTFVALYPGQASRTAGSIQVAVARPKSPRKAKDFDRTAMEETEKPRLRMGTRTSVFANHLYSSAVDSQLVSSKSFHQGLSAGAVWKDSLPCQDRWVPRVQ